MVAHWAVGRPCSIRRRSASASSVVRPRHLQRVVLASACPSQARRLLSRVRWRTSLRTLFVSARPFARRRSRGVELLAFCVRSRRLRWGLLRLRVVDCWCLALLEWSIFWGSLCACRLVPYHARASPAVRFLASCASLRRSGGWVRHRSPGVGSPSLGGSCLALRGHASAPLRVVRRMSSLGRSSSVSRRAPRPASRGRGSGSRRGIVSCLRVSPRALRFVRGTWRRARLPG